MSDRPTRGSDETIVEAVPVDAVLDPAVCDPAVLDPAVLDPAVLDPAVVESLRGLGVRSGRDVLGELTTLFLSTANTQVSAAGDLLDHADLPELARIAHALKGSGSVIGARRVAAAAATLEDACGRPERRSAGGSVAESRVALASFVDELEVFRRAVAGLGLTA